ncbi:hypothetical protein [Comamonas terrigena]|uniref:hypothetical protein n=1 Tax=Comamonas terrigena TaxID=32013 RepID=UPI002897A30C|nr:hypothetical protein [Comamonas terrigena]
MTPSFFTTRADGGFARTESLEFRTALAIARDGTESRAVTRAHPRLSLTETYYIQPPDVEGLKFLMGGHTVSKPISPLAARRGALHFEQPLGVLRPFTTFAKRSESGVFSLAQADPQGRTPSPGFSAAWPALEMQLSSPSSILESITHTFHRVQLTLDSLSPVTAFSPLHEPVYPLQAPAFLRHNFSTALKELTASDQDLFDVGFVRQKTVRYQKRTLQLSLSLLSAEQIAQFRLFACALRGAYGSFLWVAPGASEPSRWRLGSDLISISHMTANFATVQLSVVEL